MSLTRKQKQQREMLTLLRQGSTQGDSLKLIKLSQSTWYNWRKDSDFSAVVEQAIEEGKALKQSLGATPELSAGDDKLNVFLKVYIESGGLFEDSCTAAGLDFQSTVSSINPISKLYNPVFHSAYEDARKLLEVRCEDSIAENIKNRGKGYNTDARWLLERKRPEEYGAKKTEPEEQRKPAISNEQALQVLKNLLGNAESSETIH